MCAGHEGLAVTTIAKQNNVVTLINVFSVAPEHQQPLLDLLVHATKFWVEPEIELAANFGLPEDEVAKILSLVRITWRCSGLAALAFARAARCARSARR